MSDDAEAIATLTEAVRAGQSELREELFALAFPAPPEHGLLRSDLDAVHRNALSALTVGLDREGGGSDALLRRLGFRFAADVDAFLDRRPGLWQPIPLDGSELPMVGVWRRVLSGHVDVERAVSAIAAAMRPEALVSALTDPQRSALVGNTRHTELLDLALLVGLSEALARSGSDVRALLVDGGEEQAVGILLLATGDDPHPAEYDLIAEGLAFCPEPSPVDALFAALSPEARAELERRMQRVRETI